VRRAASGGKKEAGSEARYEKEPGPERAHGGGCGFRGTLREKERRGREKLQELPREGGNSVVSLNKTKIASYGQGKGKRYVPADQLKKGRKEEGIAGRPKKRGRQCGFIERAVKVFICWGGDRFTLLSL